MMPRLSEVLLSDAALPGPDFAEGAALGGAALPPSESESELVEELSGACWSKLFRPRGATALGPIGAVELPPELRGEAAAEPLCGELRWGAAAADPGLDFAEGAALGGAALPVSASEPELVEELSGACWLADELDRTPPVESESASSELEASSSAASSLSSSRSAATAGGCALPADVDGSGVLVVTAAPT